MLLDNVALRLFRRPLEDVQRQRYQSLYDLGGDEGARYVVEALLGRARAFSTSTRSRRPTGTSIDYSIAARLALVLWGSNPDLTLLEAAENGELSSPAQIEEQAERMLEDARVEGGLRDFVDQWLDLARLTDADARPDLAALGDDVMPRCATSRYRCSAGCSRAAPGCASCSPRRTRCRSAPLRVNVRGRHREQQRG